MFNSDWFKLTYLAERVGINMPVAFSKAATNTFLIPADQLYGETTSKRTWNALFKLKEQIQNHPRDEDWRVRFYIQERSDSRLANLVAYRDVESDGSDLIRVVMLNEF